MFADEMRPVVFRYLGITPESYVLDGGWGTGVFTRYIARGLKGGKIVGFGHQQDTCCIRQKQDRRRESVGYVRA